MLGLGYRAKAVRIPLRTARKVSQKCQSPGAFQTKVKLIDFAACFRENAEVVGQRGLAACARSIPSSHARGNERDKNTLNNKTNAIFCTNRISFVVEIDES